MKIAYLLDVFPVISETFIVREILALQKSGMDVALFSIMRRGSHIAGNIVHEDSRSLVERATFLCDEDNSTSKLRLIFVHALCLVKNPIRYAKCLFLALRGNEKERRHFVRSVLTASVLKSSGITHIHAHFALDGCTRSMFVSILTGIPYSFTIHAHDIFLSNGAKLQENKFLLASFVACISQYNKQFIINKFSSVDPQKLKVVHCGIELSAFPYAPKKTANNTKQLLAIGRLVEQKGYRYLVEACHRLKQTNTAAFHCYVLGEGKERDELETLIQELGLENEISLMGAVGQDEVFTALSQADLFVLPCVVEKSGTMDGIPVALMEAMALGVPVISTKLSGIPELINEQTGLIVEPQDAQHLAAAMSDFFELQQNSIKTLTDNAREKIETEFNIENEAAKMAHLFSTAS